VRAPHRQRSDQRAVLDRPGVVAAVHLRLGQPLEVGSHGGDGGDEAAQHDLRH
jgi:hypothetical protein